MSAAHVAVTAFAPKSPEVHAHDRQAGWLVALALTALVLVGALLFRRRMTERVAVERAERALRDDYDTLVARCGRADEERGDAR